LVLIYTLTALTDLSHFRDVLMLSPTCSGHVTDRVSFGVDSSESNSYESDWDWENESLSCESKTFGF